MGKQFCISVFWHVPRNFLVQVIFEPSVSEVALRARENGATRATTPFGRHRERGEDDTGKFRLLLVGDHGHGVVSETGDAAGLLLTTKDEDSMKYVNAVTVPMLSHFSVNKLVRMMMAGTCGSEEIPPQYCGKCQYNNRTNDWKSVFESSDVRAIVTMESETQSQVRIKSLSFGVSLERGISCMSDAVESSVGIQLAFTVSADSCSASYIFEYGGGLTSGALTTYEPFKRCDPRWRDSIHVVLTRPDGQQVCISPKTRKSYMKRAGAPCRSVF